MDSLIKNIFENYTFKDMFEMIQFTIARLFGQHSISFEMNKITSVNFNGKTIIDTITSDNCKSIWSDIIKLIESGDNKLAGIKELKETCVNVDYIKNAAYESSTSAFIVSQPYRFLLNPELKLYASVKHFPHQPLNDNICSPTRPSYNEKYIITLYSYLSDLTTIKKYVKQKTQQYLYDIEKERQHKKYIWTLVHGSISKYNDDSGNTTNCWNENEFLSLKTFENLFFAKKRETLEKIDFFLNNPEWYAKLGIPYALGIGLHGPPGTGKTSFIKALANKTNRHIVVLSLKFIKTKEQLLHFFFETKYNEFNKKNSIQFKDKILVIEDIDCSSNIVFQRIEEFFFLETEEKSRKERKERKEKEQKKEEDKDEMGVDKNCITLDDILNVLDGIYESTNRIVIITSNFYSKLDSALIRPGRIDITLELGNIEIKEIEDFYQYIFKERMPKINYTIPITPAIMMNKYLMSCNDKDKFLSLLSSN